jgi:phosphoribosyl-AMP cyclohydrolase
MLAWMNRDALNETLKTGQVVYYSRSRQCLWRKGESSGQTQQLKTIRMDCDKDALVLGILQQGVACHTGRRSCFSWAPVAGTWTAVEAVETDPASLYGEKK